MSWRCVWDVAIGGAEWPGGAGPDQARAASENATTAGSSPARPPVGSAAARGVRSRGVARDGAGGAAGGAGRAWARGVGGAGGAGGSGDSHSHAPSAIAAVEMI